MADFRPLAVGVAVLLGVILVAGILFWASRRGLAPAVKNSPGWRLAVLARQRPDYRILVGVPPSQPDHWASASGITQDSVVIEGQRDISLREVQAFIVAYPNGQVVDCELAGLPGPPGMTGLVRGRTRHEDVLQPADLEEGRQYIEVKHSPSQLRPKASGHYATTLTNVSRQRIRVLRFAGYTRTAEGWRLNTVTGTFYSAREFREWYGLGEKEWLRPGESACDSNNYGGPPMLWAFYCQAEDGEEFVAGGVLE